MDKQLDYFQGALDNWESMADVLAGIFRATSEKV